MMKRNGQLPRKTKKQEIILQNNSQNIVSKIQTKAHLDQNNKI